MYRIYFVVRRAQTIIPIPHQSAHRSVHSFDMPDAGFHAHPLGTSRQAAAASAAASTTRPSSISNSAVLADVSSLEVHNNLIAGWEAPRCRKHYNASVDLDPRAPFPVREDCLFLRQSGYLIHRGASVVVPMPSVGMVYLEVRRAASETIRAALNLFFGANWSTCGPQSCGGRTPFDRRCNSFCLPTFARSLGRPLFTFSFVRHPVERYYSGLEVYLMRHPSSTLSVCAAQPPGECNLTRKIHTLLTTAAGPPSNLTTHPSSGDESSAGGEQPLACLTSGIARDAHMYSQAAQLNVVTGETPRNSSRDSSQHLQLLRPHTLHWRCGRPPKRFHRDAACGQSFDCYCRRGSTGRVP